MQKHTASKCHNLWVNNLSAWQLVAVESGMCCVCTEAYLNSRGRDSTHYRRLFCVHLPLLVCALCRDVAGE